MVSFGQVKEGFENLLSQTWLGNGIAIVAVGVIAVVVPVSLISLLIYLGVTGQVSPDLGKNILAVIVGLVMGAIYVGWIIDSILFHRRDR